MRRDRMFHGHWPAVAVGLAAMAGVSACSFTAPPVAQGDADLGTAYQNSPAGGGYQQAGVDRGHKITGLPWLDRADGAALSPPAPQNGPPPAPAPRVPSPQYVDRALPWLPQPPPPQPPKAQASGQRSQTVHVPVEWHRRSGDDALATPAPPAAQAPPAPPAPPKTAAAPAAPAAPAPRPAVHLASYRSRTDAMSGWTILRDRYPQLLASARPILEDADLGDKGLYVRLIAGPFDNTSARAVCRNIMARGGWCRQVSVQP